MKLNIYLIGFLCFILINCQERYNNKHVEKNIVMDNYDIELVNALKGKKIYFGHMSVGYNIINGVTDLCSKDSQLSDWNVIEINAIKDIDTKGLFHSRNGKNGLPKSKCDAFNNFLAKDKIGDHLDIAFFKFCYVDVEKESNVQEIFDYYVKIVSEIKKQYPSVCCF